MHGVDQGVQFESHDKQAKIIARKTDDYRRAKSSEQSLSEPHNPLSSFSHLFVGLGADLHDARPQLSNYGEMSRRNAHVTRRGRQVNDSSIPLERRGLRARQNAYNMLMESFSSQTDRGRRPLNRTLKLDANASLLTCGIENLTLIDPGTSAAASSSVTLGEKSDGYAGSARYEGACFLNSSVNFAVPAFALSSRHGADVCEFVERGHRLVSSKVSRCQGRTEECSKHSKPRDGHTAAFELDVFLAPSKNQAIRTWRSLACRRSAPAVLLSMLRATI